MSSAKPAVPVPCVRSRMRSSGVALARASAMDSRPLSRRVSISDVSMFVLKFANVGADSIALRTPFREDIGRVPRSAGGALRVI
eukprot:137493-Amorphochlora_amoeboformis.AAC.1